jgi:hypothetical protein
MEFKIQRELQYKTTMAHDMGLRDLNLNIISFYIDWKVIKVPNYILIYQECIL